jgi:hypothetical protein
MDMKMIPARFQNGNRPWRELGGNRAGFQKNYPAN